MAFFPNQRTAPRRTFQTHIFASMMLLDLQGLPASPTEEARLGLSFVPFRETDQDCASQLEVEILVSVIRR